MIVNSKSYDLHKVQICGGLIDIYMLQLYKLGSVAKLGTQIGTALMLFWAWTLQVIEPLAVYVKSVCWVICRAIWKSLTLLHSLKDCW